MIMLHLRLLAVHYPVIYLDPGSGEPPENLVAQADAEHGDVLGQTRKKLQAQARIVGVAGAGRNANRL